jgi:glycosyltransferase involved in cell wall biosynthesis
MRILIINTYCYLRAGAERHAIGLGNLLENSGHDVYYFGMKSSDNLQCKGEQYFVSEIDYRKVFQRKTFLNSIKVIMRSCYSIEAKKNISKLLDLIKPDIVHLHSIRHHLTKSILPEIAKRNIPVVWTLHDYKEICPNTVLYNGKMICEKCKGRRYHNVIKYRCKKNSVRSSIITYFESIVNDRPKYEDIVDIYISPSKFLRDKFIEHGYHPEKIIRIPNFLELDTFTPEFESDNYLLFIGRLEREKGLETLIEGFAKSDYASSFELKIAGSGTMENELKDLIAKMNIPNIKLEGFKKGDELENLTRRAKAIIIPSEWYENYPFSGLEAMAYGKPVVASRLGGLPEIVEENKTGFLFEPFNSGQLSEKINILFGLDEQTLKSLGTSARKKVEEINDKYKYITKILPIYEELIKQKQYNRSFHKFN